MRRNIQRYRFLLLKALAYSAVSENRGSLDAPKTAQRVQAQTTLFVVLTAEVILIIRDCASDDLMCLFAAVDMSNFTDAFFAG